MEMEPARSGRYECLVDPSDAYVIWDKVADAPCVANGALLVFTTGERALAALDGLNGSLAVSLSSSMPYFRAAQPWIGREGRAGPDEQPFRRRVDL